MSLLDKIKNIFSSANISGQRVEFEKVIYATHAEYLINHPSFWQANLTENSYWKNEIRQWSDKDKVRFVLWLIPAIHHFQKGRTTWSSSDLDQQYHSIQQAYLQTLFRNKLLMDDDDIVQLYEAFNDHTVGDWASFTGWPVGLMLNQIEKQRKGQSHSPQLKKVLQAFRDSINAVKTGYNEKDRIKMMEKIDSILFGSVVDAATVKPARLLGEDRLADFINPAIERMNEADKLCWYKLLPLAQKASGAKPSGKFLDQTKSIIKELGAEKFKKTVHEWLQFLLMLKVNDEPETVIYPNGRTYTFISYDLITPVNIEAAKGLIWTCSHFYDQATIRLISALAEKAFKKIPGKGPTAASLGNACLYVLYKSKGLDGIGQLSGLKMRIKQASTQALIEKYLQAAATEQGVSVSEVEDMAAEDCGLVNGKRTFLFEDYAAELVITGVGKTEIKWIKPDGTLQKSVPAFVKEKLAPKLKKLKDVAKHAEQILVNQRDRIDRMFRDERMIPLEKFEQYYLNHGLISFLSNGIIWNFHSSGKILSAFRLNNYWVNAANEMVDVTGSISVSLWHPVQTTVKEIKEWRDFFVFHQITQPLKQAYREVYLLTDAEVNTKSYSNRMAAHILRQHQFNSLAKTRGWRYSLMGAFDNGINSDKATLQLSEQHIRAEYWISEVNADGAMNDTGIWNYVSTDQVRFIDTDTDKTIDLVDIGPIVFSEVLRDIDLFVGVASVGNDATWSDSGGLPAYRDYWHSYSFGDLSEVAKSRKEILIDLVPRLTIKTIATVKDKFLIVKGKLRTYKIHIGSTNILMEPNDQYLCIVPDRTQKNYTESVFLPFEGDSGLSIILSKAFLLADDDKITDTTITTQINRK